MTGKLIIFIDSLPYSVLKREKNLYLSNIGNITPVQPGLGYSLNVYAELFAGLTPDEAGFFNKWMPKRDVQEKSFNDYFFRFLDYSRVNTLLSRGLHIIYAKATGRGNLANIPFSYLKYFEKKGANFIFFSKEFPTIFNEFSLEMSISPLFKEKIGENDKQAFEKALKKVNNGKNLFIMFGDLDGISHVYGLESDQYKNHILSLDQMCQKIVKEFKRKNGDDSEIIIFSDHGMASVNEGIELNLERIFGKVGVDRYLYFLDSTFLRLWIRDTSLKSDIEEYLKSLKKGILLDDDLRLRYGVTNRAFGDYLFLLNEGKVFFPGFMGGRLVKAMHGYQPELESQAGIFIHSKENKRATTPNTAKMIYKYLKENL